MSVQVAKSTGNTTSTAGRRTPLSLSGSVAKPTKVQQSDSEKDTSNSGVTSNTSSANPNSKTATKNDKNENSTIDLKKIDKSDKKTTNTKNQTTENTNNSAKEKSSDDKKKDDKDKKKDKDSVKKDDKKQENGLKEAKDSSSKENGHKDVEKKNEKSGEKSEKLSVEHKETSKQKEMTEQKEKEQEVKEAKASNKSPELNKLDEKGSSRDEDNESKQGKKKVEDVFEKSIDKDKIEKEAADTMKKSRKEPETPKKDEKKFREIDSVTPKKEIVSNQPVSNKSIASLAVEKDLKGFSPDGDEMESLLFDSESDTNGGPCETSTPGKILKIKQSPHHSIQKNMYERRETYEKYEPLRIKEDKYDISSASATPLERPQFTSSYRTISGRRSLRPSKDYSFQGTYRESYRKINTELDYTTSSMNVTVGSEIPNESSFSIFGRGKKRERTPPVTSSNDIPEDNQMDVEISPKSPKRARLDFSGIIGFVASPVTLLRAKLSRAKLQCSTPNGKVTSTTKDEEDGVENVSVIATDEMASSDIADASEDVNIKDAEPSEPSEEEVNEELRDVLDVEPEDLKKPQIVTESMENINKRRMCNVM